jgi:hypothetical protein
MQTNRKNYSVIVLSSFVALIGLALTAAGLLGASRKAAAGDYDPSPQSTQVVSTQVVVTEQPTQPPATTVPTTVSTTEVPTTVPTTVPTNVVATSTSVVTLVTPTTVQTQGGGIATATTQQLAPQTQTGPAQNTAGVQALPRTGAGSTSGGLSWLLVAAGIVLALSGLAGVVYERRRA